MVKKRLLISVLLVSCTLLIWADNKKQPTVSSLQKEQKELQQQIENTNKLLKQTQNNEKATVHKINLLSENIIKQRQLINTLDSEINLLAQKSGILQQRQDSLENLLERLKNEYAQMIRDTHYARTQNSTLLFILSAQNFHQLVRRAQHSEDISVYLHEKAERIKNIQSEVMLQREIIENNKRDKTQALDTRRQEQQNLTRDEKKQKQMLEDLKKKEKNLKAEQQKQQKKAAELNKRIDELIRKQNESNTTLTKEQKLLAGDFEKNKGRMPWPVVNGTVTGDFGKQQHPLYKDVILDNKGLYVSTTKGSNARAVFDGEVTACIVLGTTYAIIIQHGNYRTVYSGLSKVYIKQGDHVKAKQDIGQIYTDPEQDNKTELYFQVYKNKTIENPRNWLSK